MSVYTDYACPQRGAACRLGAPCPQDPAPGFWCQIPALLPSTKLYLASGVLLLRECSSRACFEKPSSVVGLVTIGTSGEFCPGQQLY